jgi:DNA-binding cell septation regulator SpoVG
MKISEVNIQFIKPADGLVGFASLVIDDAFYLGSIGIHQKLGSTGYRLTYPTKKGPMNDRPVFHPIRRATSAAIEQAVFTKLKNVMSKVYDRYD